MSKEPNTAPVENVQTATTKSTSNWEAFEKAKLTPVEITCQAYQPVHQHDASCHTKLNLKVASDSIKRHIEGEHGNRAGTGFHFKLRKTDSAKPWTGWKEITDLGIEVADFRCDVCDQDVRFNPQYILKHMQPHNGKTRRIQPGGHFNATLNLTAAGIKDTEDEFYEEQAI